MDLTTIRNRINRIDHEMLRLLQERMELSLRTKKFKKEIRDTRRERQVLENIRKASEGLVGPEFSSALFGHILQESKTLQASALRLVGFQGEHGAFGESVAKAYDPRLIPIPYQEIADITEDIGSGALDYGIYPVGPSAGGTVHDAGALPAGHRLTAVAEAIMAGNLCLLGLHGTELRDIEIVYSDPQVLARCGRFLAKRKLVQRPCGDAAGAARMLASARPASAAAIAPPECARTYDLKVLRENVQDAKNDVRRFVVLTREAPSKRGPRRPIIKV